MPPRVPVAPLRLVTARLARKQRPHLGAVIRAVAIAREGNEAPRLELHTRVPEHLAQRPVDLLKASVEASQRHPYRGLLEGSPKALLCLLYRPLCPPALGDVAQER